MDNQVQVNYDEVVQKLLENQKAMLLDNAILQVKIDKLQQENESMWHIKGWLKYKLHALRRAIQ